MDDVWLDSGMKVPIGRWVYDPCYRCGRQPAVGEVLQLDIVAQVVTCFVCHCDDMRKIGEAITAKVLPDLGDGGGSDG